jgi:hypothetical protein
MSDFSETKEERFEKYNSESWNKSRLAHRLAQVELQRDALKNYFKCFADGSIKARFHAVTEFAINRNADPVSSKPAELSLFEYVEDLEKFIIKHLGDQAVENFEDEYPSLLDKIAESDPDEVDDVGNPIMPDFVFDD